MRNEDCDASKGIIQSFAPPLTEGFFYFYFFFSALPVKFPFFVIGTKIKQIIFMTYVLVGLVRGRKREGGGFNARSTLRIKCSKRILVLLFHGLIFMAKFSDIGGERSLILHKYTLKKG